MIITGKEGIINFDNIENIYIDYSNGRYKIISITISGRIFLAEYETKERAKEVLQEIIQRYLETKNPMQYQEVAPIYEMPEE